jgi:hypothetical protein
VSARRAALVALLALVPAAAGAEMRLPAGFAAKVYVGGDGFAAAPVQGSSGIPSVSTLAFDDAGFLYLARTGRRYSGGEVEDVWPIYRVPPGGARMTPDTEPRFFHGPPLPNAQVAAIRAGRELLVTTYDRDRAVGVLYVVRDGHAELLAGGTPPRGAPPLLRQPEGAAVDSAGNVYVADRNAGAVVKLDASGHVLDRQWVAVMRPRVLAVDGHDHVWVGSDGHAEAPWQRGPGELWRVAPGGESTLVLRGAVPTAIAVGPRGRVFMADRQNARIVVVTADGRSAEFARFTDNDAPRSLCFAPDTPATRRAGIAGDLFVVTIRRGAWPVNEVVRVSGAFDRFVSDAAP